MWSYFGLISEPWWAAEERDDMYERHAHELDDWGRP